MDKEALLKNDLIYKKVDDFIEQLHENNIVLNPKAQTLMITENKGKNSWGKIIKESQALSNRIGEEIAYYQKVNSSEKMVDAIVKESKSNFKKNNFKGMDNYVHNLNMRSELRNRKLEVADNLFRYIELAYCNNVVDDIGLGEKLKKLEEDNVNQKKLIASLEKLNKDLKKENDRMHKLFPDNNRGKTEVGTLDS